MRDAPSPDARTEFDREAASYDATAVETMPGYNELHDVLVWGIPFLPTRAFRVLELGVGTGTLTYRILSAFPHARLTGIDLSPRMIEACRRKVRKFGDRVELHAASITEYASQGSYDAVVSSLAIHHLSNPEKWTLFGRVRRLLSEGGYFGDADDHLPEDPVFDSRFAAVAENLAHLRNGARSSRIPQRAWHDHEPFDHPCTLSAELRALEKAGFQHIDVPWRFFGQAVVWAYR